MIEHRSLYFPESRLHSTPAVLQMRFEEVYFDAADGVSLHGWYIPSRRGMPVVLFCHGNAGNIADRVRMLGFLKNLGVSTFIFDYRGYGKSQGKASEKGTYIDVRGALAWLKKAGLGPCANNLPGTFHGCRRSHADGCRTGTGPPVPGMPVYLDR